MPLLSWGFVSSNSVCCKTYWAAPYTAGLHISFCFKALWVQINLWELGFISCHHEHHRKLHIVAPATICEECVPTTIVLFLICWGQYFSISIPSSQPAHYTGPGSLLWYFWGLKIWRHLPPQSTKSQELAILYFKPLISSSWFLFMKSNFSLGSFNFYHKQRPSDTGIIRDLETLQSQWLWLSVERYITRSIFYLTLKLLKTRQALPLCRRILALSTGFAKILAFSFG